ncbi:MAG: FGGY-family carbohydrate kinase [Lewinella sp.]
MKLTAIFDIGKTNKKFFIFDEKYREVHKSYARFKEEEDLEGFPCDDLPTIKNWVEKTLEESLKTYGEQITSVNFSTYGASFVHLDANGKALTPLINYLKPFPEELLASFYAKYGTPEAMAKETASPQMGMLNSGMQLYWLKHTHPEVFEKVRWSLHFPQYLSYLFTGLPVSEYTSIGCHTGLWDFAQNDYHQWVYAEGINRVLPPVVTTDTSINTTVFGHKLKVGVGIHDSSSALVPYLQAERKSFLLVSTGTWSIALNPYSEAILTKEDLRNDCLNFMRPEGQSVKAARLFLGNEYSLQVEKLQQYFGVDKDAHKHVLFDKERYDELLQQQSLCFRFESLNVERKQPKTTSLVAFADFETAYHQLFIELMELQIAAIQRAVGHTVVEKIYVDGGFADSDLFVKILALHFPDRKIRATKSPLGSALGAAIVVSDDEVKKKFLKTNYGMRKIRSRMTRIVNQQP